MSGSATDCLSAIQNQFNINAIFSHQEIGLLCTFERDKQVSEWFQSQGIPWREFEHGASFEEQKTDSDGISIGIQLCEQRLTT